jgi:hypothetical protein
LNKLQTSKSSSILPFIEIGDETIQCDVHHVFERQIVATPVGPSLTPVPGNFHAVSCFSAQRNLRELTQLLQLVRICDRRSFCRIPGSKRSIRTAGTSTNQLFVAQSACFCHPMRMYEHLTILSGRANPDLALEIATYLGISLGQVDVGNFSRWRDQLQTESEYSWL